MANEKNNVGSGKRADNEAHITSVELRLLNGQVVKTPVLAFDAEADAHEYGQTLARTLSSFISGLIRVEDGEGQQTMPVQELLAALGIRAVIFRSDGLSRIESRLVRLAEPGQLITN